VPDKNFKFDEYGQLIVEDDPRNKEFHPPDGDIGPIGRPAGRIGPSRRDGPSSSAVLAMAIGGFACLLVVGGMLVASGWLRIPFSPTSSPRSDLTSNVSPTVIERVVVVTSVPPTVAPRSNNAPVAVDAVQDIVKPPLATSAIVDLRVSLGRSVRGRDLQATVIGHDGGNPVVVVGSIQGDQTPTRALVEALVEHYRQGGDRVPQGVLFYFIPSINPDGNASGSRYNANDVDLNRNWDTDDWRSNPAVPGYSSGKAGAGGSRPFSEPETVALRDLLTSLRDSSSRLRVVTLHSSVNISGGEVYPGGSDAENIAATYSDTARYSVEYEWAQYITSGEAVTWCSENSIVAIDVVFPASQRPSSTAYGSTSLLQVTIAGLEAISR